MNRRYLVTAVVSAVAMFAAVFLANSSLDSTADWTYLTGRATVPPVDLNDGGEAKYKSALVRTLPRGSIRLAVFGNSRATAIDVSQAVAERGRFGVNLATGGGTLRHVETFIETVSILHPEMQPIVGFNFDNCYHGEAKNYLYLKPVPDIPSILDALQRLGSLRALYRGVWAHWTPRALSEVEMVRFGNNIRHFDFNRISDIRAAVAVDRTIYPKGYDSPLDDTCYAVLNRIRKRHPDAIYFIHPVSREMLEWIEASSARAARVRFLETLKEIGPVYDFTCAREITDEITNYRDAHHYRREIGSLVLADLMSAEQGDKPRYACVIR